MSLNEVIRVLEEKRNIWGLLFLLGSLYLGRRAYKYHKKHNLKQLVRNLLGWKWSKYKNKIHDKIFNPIYLSLLF